MGLSIYCRMALGFCIFGERHTGLELEREERIHRSLDPAEKSHLRYPAYP